MAQFTMQVFNERPRKSCCGYLNEVKETLCFGRKKIKRFFTNDPCNPHTKFGYFDCEMVNTCRTPGVGVLNTPYLT